MAWIFGLPTKETQDLKPSQLSTPMVSFFFPPRTFFTTKTSGFYDKAPDGVKKGDKVALLFPRAYMTFALRPVDDHYQMVGPCLVPPRLWDAALEKLYSPAYDGQEFDIR
jgi:hypothetical protein